MTVKSIEETLGDLEVESITIQLANGHHITVAPKWQNGRWRAGYQGFRTEYVGGGDGPEEAIHEALSLAQRCGEMANGKERAS